MQTNNYRCVKTFIAMSVVLAFFINASIAVADSLRVVTTTSTFADLVKQIGGDRVDVVSIAKPRFNPHFIEPKPTDVLKVKRADLFVHSGLDLEAWRVPLVNAAGNVDVRPGGKRELELSKGIRLLNVPTSAPSRADGDIHLFGNPHYWLDPRNAKTMARTVSAKLSEVDPAGRESYEGNLVQFEQTIERKHSEWQSLLSPFKGKELLGYHDEWVYLMEFAGLKMNSFLEPKPGISPTPRHLEELVALIKSTGVKAIVQASFYPTDAAESLRAQTGIKVLELCQNVAEKDQCGGYVAMVDYDLKAIVEALNR